MRLLLEIIVIGALIALSWEKSFKERAGELPWFRDKATAKTSARSPQTQHPQTRLQPFVTPAPTISGSWLWDRNRKTPPDPAKNHAEATPHLIRGSRHRVSYWRACPVVNVNCTGKSGTPFARENPISLTLLHSNWYAVAGLRLYGSVKVRPSGE